MTEGLPPDAAVPALGALVRRHDPARYFAALFAPDAVRDTLFTLYAFDHELARARAVASQPGIALIRLQWWREVVQGVPKRHDIATPLHRAVQSGALPAEDLLAMIDGREMEDDASIPDLAAWRHYCLLSAGAAMAAAGAALGADAGQKTVLRQIGALCGAAQLIQSTQALARQGRCLLPEDALLAQGLTVDTVIAQPEDTRLTAVHSLLRATALGLAPGRHRLPPALLPAALPLVPALHMLRGGQFGTRDRVAMLWARWRGVLPVVPNPA